MPTQCEVDFRAAFDHSPAGMCIVGPDGVVRAGNQVLADLLRRSCESLIGVAFAEVVAPSDVGCWTRMSERDGAGHHVPAEEIGVETYAQRLKADLQENPAVHAHPILLSAWATTGGA